MVKYRTDMSLLCAACRRCHILTRIHPLIVDEDLSVLDLRLVTLSRHCNAAKKARYCSS
jgi:hypothetical protein